MILKAIIRLGKRAGTMQSRALNRTHEDSNPQLFDNPEEYLTYNELGHLLGITIRTLRRYVAADMIPYLRIGGKMIRFEKSEIAAWLRRRQKRRR